MAVLSFANAMTQLARVVKVVDQLDKAIQTNSSGSITNFVALREVIEQAIAGDYGNPILEVLDGIQNNLISLVTEEQIQATLDAAMREVMLSIDRDTTASFDDMLLALRDYMAANSQTVLEREMSYGSVTADGGNVGNMAGYALTVDKYGNQLQGSTAESVIIEVVEDVGTNRRIRNKEVLEYRGDAKRQAKTAGSGLAERISASYDQNNVLRNPRFSSYLGTRPTAGSPSTPSAVGNVSNFVLSGTTGVFQVGVDYLTRGGQATDSRSRSLVFVDSGNFYQLLTDAGLQFDPEVPYLPAALLQRRSSATGTATVGWGSKSEAFTVGSLANNDWEWVVCARDMDLYYDNWKQDDARFTFTVASLATGTLVVQEVGLYAGRLIDGVWHWFLGMDTVALRGDKFTFSKSQSNDGINQRILIARSGAGRRRGLTLPSANSLSETVADA